MKKLLSPVKSKAPILLSAGLTVCLAGCFQAPTAKQDAQAGENAKAAPSLPGAITPQADSAAEPRLDAPAPAPSASPEPAPSTTARPVSSISQTSWKDSRLATLQFDAQDDQRKDGDFETFRINPEGTIHAKDFLQMLRPVDLAVYQQRVRRAPGDTRETEVLYREYLKTGSQRVLGAMALTRIIDNEAMKRRMAPPTPSEARVNYVVRSILTQIAISKHAPPAPAPDAAKPAPGLWDWILSWFNWGKKEDAKPATPPSFEGRPDAEMYAWLQEAVGKNDVKFNIDWTFVAGGMDASQKQLLASEPAWPAVSMYFNALPKTVEDFRAQMKARMVEAYRPQMRQAIWRELVAKHDRYLGLKEALGVSAEELDHAYDALKNPNFMVNDLSADVHDVAISGEKAREFKDRFGKLFKEKVQAFQKEFLANDFPSPQPGSTVDVTAMMKKLKEKLLNDPRIAELRRTAPAEVLKQALGEFDADIQAGRLNVFTGKRHIEVKGTDDVTPAQLDGKSTIMFERRNAKEEPPVASSLVHSQQRLKLREIVGKFSVNLGSLDISGSLVPVSDTVDKDGVSYVMFVNAFTYSDQYPLAKDHPMVKQALTNLIQTKILARSFRTVVYNLFLRNPLNLDQDLCADAQWPCVADRPLDLAAELTEALFPEALYPGDTLGVNPDGSPVMSTSFSRPDEFVKVQEISLGLLNTAMQLPNP